MAIHIDIYAHLKKQQLIKEGEQLKKYVESLEKDINVRQERGARGLSNTVIKMNDQIAKSYDGLINSHDSYVKAKQRMTAADKELIRVNKDIEKMTLKQQKLANTTRKTAQGQANLEKQQIEVKRNLLALEREHTAALAEQASAEQHLTYATQKYTAATNDKTRADKLAREEAKRHGDLLRSNGVEFHKLSAATIKQRRALEDLSTTHGKLIKDNKAITNGLEKVREATAKTTAEREKYKKMVKEGIADSKQLQQQTDRVTAAHKAEKVAIRGVTDSIKDQVSKNDDLMKSQKLSKVVVDANQKSLKEFAKAAQQSGKQIKDLRKSNADLIDGNVKLSRSFQAARDATKAANREHQEYKRLIASGASQDVLRKKAERVNDAYQKQAREVRAAGAALNESLTQTNDRNTFIRSQSNAMRDFAREITDATGRVDSLRTANENALRSNSQLSRAFNVAGRSVRSAAAAQKDYDRLVASGAGRDQLAKAAEKASAAFKQQRRDVDEASNALVRHHKENRASGIRGLTGGPGEYASRNIAALTPLGRVNSGVGLPLLGLAGNFAEAGVTASQSIALLPALATSAAAAIGTLAIGFHGFFDTVGDMGDPKKFAEGLANLAPNAQQAALAIKALVDGPLGDLKATVQDNLFANVAPQLEAVVGTLGPTMSNLFNGLSKEFNKAFIGITNVLMMPESQASLTGIVDGIVTGFQHLLPMLSPLTEAFLTLTEVGASFLPQLGDSFTRVATTFRDFVQGAAADGSLQTFIQRGIDAAGYLIDWIKRLGVSIYETFGNKTPAEFSAALDGALSAISGILKAIQTLSDVINALTPVISTVFGGLSDAVGGASNLAYAFVGIWTGVKLFKAIDTVAGLFGKSIGGALTGLVGTAEKSSTGITAALAKVKIPPVLLAAMRFAGVPLAIASAGATAAGVGHEGVSTRKSGSMDWLPDWANPGVIFNPENWIDNALGKFDTQPEPGSTPAVPGVPGGVGGGAGMEFPGAAAQPFEWGAGTTPAGGPYDPKPLPSNAGKYELSNIPIGQFGGAQWQVPQGATDLPVDYDNLGKQGFYRPDPLKIMDKESAVTAAGQTAEEARSKYLDLVAAGNTRQEELNKASNDVKQAENNYLKSMRDLKEEQRGEFEDLTGQMDKFGKDLKSVLGDMGAGLDADLGISKGLAGLADNLVRFVGSLALAPTIAGLKKQQFDAGFPNGEGAGMGLIGMLTEPYAKPTRNVGKDNADAYRAAYGIQNYGLNTVTPGGPVPTDIPQTLAGSLRAAGIDPAMYGVINGFAKTEGNNPSGVPTLGFTDGQAGTSLAGHADALAKQIGARSSVTGPFPADGTPAEQASWMATLVGQNGVPSDWQGNAQPARSDYVGRIVAAMGGGGAPTGAPAMPAGAGTPSAAWPGAMPGESARDFAHRSRQPIFESQGYTVGDHQADKYGEHQNGALDIMVPSIAEGQKVLQQVLSDPNTYGAIFNNQAYGYGQGSGARPYSGGNTGDPTQDHQDHVHAWYKPGGKDNIAPLPGGMLPPGAAIPGMPGTPGGAMGSVPSGSGTPVFVTNWPGGGGGFGGGGAAGGPAGSPAGGGGPMAAGPGGPGVPHAGSGAAPGPGGLPNITNGRGTGPLPGPGGGPQPFTGPQTSIEAIPPGGNFLGAWKNAIAGNNTTVPSDILGMTPHGRTAGAGGFGGASASGTASGTAGSPIDGSRGQRFRQTDNPNRLEPVDRFVGSFGMRGYDAVSSTANSLMNPGDALTGTGALVGLGGQGAPGVGESWKSLGKDMTHWDQFASGDIAGGLGGAAFDFWQLGSAARATKLNPHANYELPPPFQPPRSNYEVTSPRGPEYGDIGSGPSVGRAEREEQWRLQEATRPPWLPPLPFPSFAKGGEVPIMAHSGEHVLTRKDVAAMGGQQGVMDFRNGLQSFNEGGPVNDILMGGGGNTKDAGKGETTKPGDSKPAPNKVLDRMREANAGVNTQAPANPLTAPLSLGVPAGAGPVGAPVPAAAAAPTPIGAQVDPNTGIGDGFKADLSALGAAASVFPGGGAAAQTGIKLAERGIEYAGQAAAIGVQGFMETFLPTGGSELANNNWFTRLAGAAAGSAPAIANVAGGLSNPEGGPGGGLPPGPMGIPGLGPSTPEQIAGQSMAPPAQAAPAGNSVTNFNYTANGVKGAEEAFPDAARAWEARPGQR